MSDLLPLLIIPGLMVALGVAATLFGADTRDGNDWPPRPDHPQFRHHV